MNYKILVVDDNIQKAILIQTYLAWHLGIPDDCVIGRYSTTEALAYLKNNPIDILITKYEMRPLDGVGLIEQAETIYPNIVTCLIGVSTDLEQDNAVQTVAPNGLLNEPYDPKVLIELVGALTSLIEPPNRYKEEAGQIDSLNGK